MLGPALLTALPLLLAARTADDVGATIVAMERAALDRSDRSDFDGFLEISTDDVVYFDPSLDAAIHGRDALAAYYRAMPPSPPQRGEMINVKVQVAGEAAVLTFNYFTARQRETGKGGWNATEVYRLTRDGWRIMHTHWAYHKPEEPK